MRNSPFEPFAARRARPASPLLLALASAWILAGSTAAGAQEPAAETPRDTEPCRHAPEFRQLDFWIGAWDVYHAGSGRKLGENIIQPLLGDCALLENWTGAGGSSGKSLNFYDRQRQTWRQVWVSDRANVLDYRHGEFRDGAMRFRGITIGEGGDTTLQKLTFFHVAPDTVRQVMESSADGGATWSTDWVGIYVRRPAADQHQEE